MTIKSEKIIFISAGMINAKKTNNPIAFNHSYLNYGLLGLASIVKNKGYDVSLYHGKFEDPIIFFNKYINNFKEANNYPIFLSLPSSLSIEWAVSFVTELKNNNPKVSIVIGGRWVVMEDGKWIREKFNNLIDLVVYGLSENRIIDLIDKKKWTNLNHTDISTDLTPEIWQRHYPKYDYSIMPDYKEFQPSIDTSRGCGRECNFCLEGNIKLVPMKDPNLIIAEVVYLQELYKKMPINFYFEASHFSPPKKWIEKFSELVKEQKLSFKWRAETRADNNIITENVSLLAEAGLKVLDVGLESASPRQLLAMGKTKDHKDYLCKASKLLQSCRDYDVWAKINILLYPGECAETVQETMNWLDEHKECIKGVSVNPLMVYRNTSYVDYLEKLGQTYGASPVENSVEEKGYCYMNLSEEMQLEQIEQLRIELCQRYMSADNYYDLKSFSYFSESILSKEDFINKCNTADKSKLPFRVSS